VNTTQYRREADIEHRVSSSAVVAVVAVVVSAGEGLAVVLLREPK
jgi:hypothetical protein